MIESLKPFAMAAENANDLPSFEGVRMTVHCGYFSGREWWKCAATGCRGRPAEQHMSVRVDFCQKWQRWQAHLRASDEER
jgi:hypothetical protein